MDTSEFGRFSDPALLILASLAYLCLAQNASAQTSGQPPVVRAVLFYRSTCEHCQQLVAEVMPPLLDKYKDRLQVFYCDITLPPVIIRAMS